MDFSDRVLGKNVAAVLVERVSAPVLRIGKDAFTRRELAAVSCFNFLAAQRLSKLLDDFSVRNTKDVFERIPPSSLALPTLGAISLAVLGAAFEARGLGGPHPLESWMTRHAKNAQHPLQTFSTIKVRERKRETEERKLKRRATRGKLRKSDEEVRRSLDAAQETQRREGTS
jgi:hypothetical protein